MEAKQPSAVLSTPAVDRVTEVFQTQRRQLVLSALLILNNVADAEDTVAETFGRLLPRADQLPTGPGLVPYIWKSVLNGARTAAGRRRRHEQIPDNAEHLGDSPDDEVVRYHEYRAVLAAVRALPDRQMSVLILRYWHGLSIEDVATAMDISTGAVKTHGHRALRAVKRSLEGNGYGPVD